ncbi:zinc finger protein 239-like isoform X1 [Artemia franciscana]|uniref:zinc finger protein 239-like isoform X1 n=1 Tax=Artemia franciscana TaxID=6661 RepID=UPI0032D9B807
MDRAGLPEHLYIKQEVEDILPSDSQEHFVSTSPSLSSRQGDNILATPDASVKLEHNSDPLHLESSASSNTDTEITAPVSQNSHQEYGTSCTTDFACAFVKVEIDSSHGAEFRPETSEIEETYIRGGEIVSLVHRSNDLKPKTLKNRNLKLQKSPQLPLERPYKCDMCQKSFAQKNHLTSHLKFHTREKQFQCELCKNYFSRRSNLNVHMRTHTGEKPYVCEICGKGFTQTYNLTIHMRSHTGEKPFKCELCNKSFTKLQSLTIHMRTHTGERPYTCEICGRGFIQMPTLIIHRRTHSGERPYKCQICMKSFIHMQSLSLHMGTHTGVKPYECKVCKKKFAQRPSLIKHFRTHDIDIPTKVNYPAT